MATTFSEAKIHVNYIAPSIFPSEVTAGSSHEFQKSKLDMQVSNPVGWLPISCFGNQDISSSELTFSGRPSKDSDMGGCILFLVGPEGVFLNSQVLYSGGGEYRIDDTSGPYDCLSGNNLVRPPAT